MTRAPEGMTEAGSDNSIMLRVRDGHLEELGVLFERYHVRLLNYFIKMTGNRSVSEDLVQESFLRILRYKDSFRGEQGEFTIWMFRLARGIGIDHFRATQRARTTDLDESLASHEPSALDGIESDQEAQLIRRSILELSPEKRDVLVLHRYHFKKFTEIAEILDCTVSAAKTRAHRAMKELAEIYLRLEKEGAA